MPTDHRATSRRSDRAGWIVGTTVLVILLAWAAAGALGRAGLPGIDLFGPDEPDGASGQAPRPSCAAARFAPPCGSALWGVYTLQGATPATAVTDLEAQVGRRFDLTSRYHDFSTHPSLGVFPDDSEQELGQDRTLLMSWQARDGVTNTDLRWSEVADGTYDRYIDSAATRLKAWNRPVIIAFDAEFDKLTGVKGPVQDYVSAFRHVVEIFRRYDVTNVAWAWVPTGYLRGDNPERMFAGYPGDDYVDWVGYDPFNFYACNGTPWRSFEKTVAPMYQWLLRKGLGTKPFLLSEYGTQYDADRPARSRRWYADIPGVLQRYPNLRGLVRFDADGTVNSGAHCDLWLDNGPGMRKAFAEAGRSPAVTN